MTRLHATIIDRPPWHMPASLPRAAFPDRTLSSVWLPPLQLGYPELAASLRVGPHPASRSWRLTCNTPREGAETAHIPGLTGTVRIRMDPDAPQEQIPPTLSELLTRLFAELHRSTEPARRADLLELFTHLQFFVAPLPGHQGHALTWMHASEARHIPHLVDAENRAARDRARIFTRAVPLARQSS